MRRVARRTHLSGVECRVPRSGLVTDTRPLAWIDPKVVPSLQSANASACVYVCTTPHPQVASHLSREPATELAQAPTELALARALRSPHAPRPIGLLERPDGALGLHRDGQQALVRRDDARVEVDRLCVHTSRYPCVLSLSTYVCVRARVGVCVCARGVRM